ncbi:hypothetical protein KCP75_22355 [Salmonella enterica subsp. enterica]|nr:hypothetical protein KCP75_22355 [Salmonella enterica subsp. enterica]
MARDDRDAAWPSGQGKTLLGGDNLIDVNNPDDRPAGETGTDYRWRDTDSHHGLDRTHRRVRYATAVPFFTWRGTDRV